MTLVPTRDVEKIIRPPVRAVIPTVLRNEDLNVTKGFSERFPKVKERVLSIVKNDEYARKNYLWLCLVYFAKCGQIKIIIPQEKFHEVNSPETITRAFRKLVEEAKKGDKSLSFLLKDTETLNMRADREGEISEYFSNEKIREKSRSIK